LRPGSNSGREIDILISSTAAETHLLTPPLLVPILRDPSRSSSFYHRYCCSADVAPEVNEFDGVYLYDIDSLQEIASESHELRGSKWLAAEAIIDEHVADFQKHLELSQSGTRPTEECPTRVSGELRASKL